MARRGSTLHTVMMAAAAVSMLLLGACASDPQLGALDAGDSFCARQYREHRDRAPTPAGLSKKDRGRYEERATDYHVSQGCQREAGNEVTIPVPRAGR